jgi:hypothetical protein
MRSVVVSGISSGFPLLSQCSGQVAHVLLTRSPLIPTRRWFTARLACVKHTASVRPEPGSNSPSKVIWHPGGDRGYRLREVVPVGTVNLASSDVSPSVLPKESRVVGSRAAHDGGLALTYMARC